MKFLLDTCVVSDFFKKNEGVISAFKRNSPSELAISSITVMEVEYGLVLNKERAIKIEPLWQALIKQIQVIDYNQGDARLTAQVRGFLKEKGMPIGPYDILLAGMALHRDLIFVTSNQNEFKRIPHLHLEDWRT